MRIMLWRVLYLKFYGNPFDCWMPPMQRKTHLVMKTQQSSQGLFYEFYQTKHFCSEVIAQPRKYVQDIFFNHMQ